MRRASISIDFLFSLVIALSILVLFFPLAYMQLEDVMVLNYQRKAESMSMGVGSAINHFHAIDGSEMNLTLKNPVNSTGPGVSAGLPFPEGVILQPISCKVRLDPENNVTRTNISYVRVETNEPESVTATYPAIVKDSYADTYDCNGGVIEVNGE